MPDSFSRSPGWIKAERQVEVIMLAKNAGIFPQFTGDRLPVKKFAHLIGKVSTK